MINLITLNLEKINLNNKEHMYVLNKLKSDIFTETFVTKDLVGFVSENNNEDLKNGASFILKDKDESVGIIGTKEMDNNGNLELWCVIDSEKRGNGYAGKALAQITPYLLETVKGLKDIKLVIDRKNVVSKKVAESFGYVKVSDATDIDDKEIYKFFGK